MTEPEWTGGLEFGCFGPVLAPNTNSWWRLDDRVMSTTKIDPPPGFRRRARACDRARRR